MQLHHQGKEKGKYTEVSQARYTDEQLQDIDDAIAAVAAMPEPWFLYVAPNAGHSPLHMPPDTLLDAPAPEDPTAIQQFTAIEWSTEPQPFPKLFGIGEGGPLDEKFWLPLVACAATILGLEYLYRDTLVGRAFLAIAEDNFAARALGLPERNLRMASYALAGAVGGLAGFSGGELLLAFFGNGGILNFYGFVPVALGGIGNNRGAIVGGLVLGVFQQAAIFMVGGVFASVAVFAVFIVVLLAAPQGLFGAASARRV
mgnify:CR=1 FL=1